MSIKIWKDRDGRWIDAKEFKSRFASGLEEVSPLQQTKLNMFFQLGILGGIVAGIVVNYFAEIWWLFTILIFSMGIGLLSMLGSWQKYKMLKKMQSSFEELEENELNDSNKTKRGKDD